MLKDWTLYSELVTQAYMEAPDYDSSVTKHWNALNQSNYTLFKRLLSKVNVVFYSTNKSKVGTINILGRDYKIIYQADGEEYQSQQEMKSDFEATGTLKISIDHSDHPIFSIADNIVFRTVHDYIVHILGNHDFSAKGEIASYNRHAKLAPKEAIPAIFTEVVGQACFAIVKGSFPKQKIAILNGFDYNNVGMIDDTNYEIIDKKLVKKSEIKSTEEPESNQKQMDSAKKSEPNKPELELAHHFKNTVIKKLLREALVTEINVGDAWTQFYSNKEKFPALKGDVELFNKLNDLYPKKGDNFNKGYFTWLYNLLKTGNLKEEDFYKAKEYLNLFGKFINKIPKENRDINKFKTLGDLYLVVKPFAEGEPTQATSKSDELRKIKKEEIDKVFENENWLVMIPKTERASCLIGKGTQWCTVAEESENYFERYNNDGPLYVIVNKDSYADGSKKYQLHFESDSLMDENDRPIPATHFFDYVENANELQEFFQGASDKFWEFVLETSVEDIADGHYSEIFNDALNADNVDPVVYSQTLDRLRNGTGDAIYTGFIHEKDPDSIDKWQIESLLEDDELEEESKNYALQHLEEIGFDFGGKMNAESFQTYVEANDALKEHKLQINKTYELDKGKTLRINRVNFSNESNGRYNVTMNGKKGNINLNTLLNLIHQGQLFDEGVKIIKKTIK